VEPTIAYDVLAWNIYRAEKSGNFTHGSRRRGRRFHTGHCRRRFEGSWFETAITDSAEEAMRLLQSKAMDYRAPVSDINLRGRMTGWEVAKQAREIDPEFPIVYMTGAAGGD
jgi:CheY-like chemotaxis protein